MAFVATAGQKQLVPERAIRSSSSLGYSSFGELAPGDSVTQQQREFQVVHRYTMAQQHAERAQSRHFAHSEDTKPSTHDFLSLYDKGSQQAENVSSAGLSSSLTTHDFLQPLERNGARPTSRDAPVLREKHSSGENGQSRHSTPGPGEQAHPTSSPNYAAIKVPYTVPPNSMLRMVGEAEAVRQGRNYPIATLSSREDHSGSETFKGVEIAVGPEAANAQENLAHWPGVRFQFGMPPDLTFTAGNPAAKSVVENGHQLLPTMTKHWAQAAQGMIESPKRPARPPSDEDEDDDEDSSERPKVNRKEPMLRKGDGAQRMDSKNADLRGVTPRSKHSATEQRRRSKINDRFQMLRDLVPHSDQKRDKASFLLEVIEYIQVLQDKVRKYETVEQGRHQERLKSMVWDLCKRGAAGSGDETSQINALVFAKDLNSGVRSVDIKPGTEVPADRVPRSSEEAAPISEAHSTGGLNAQQASSRPACSIHSCVSSLGGEKESATAVTAVGVPLQQAIPSPHAFPIVPSKGQREQDSNRGTPASNSNAPRKEKTSDMDLVSSRENGYAHDTTPDHQFEVRPRISSGQADQNSDHQPKDHQMSATTIVGRMDGVQAGLLSSAPRQPQGGPQHKEDANKHTRHPQTNQNDHMATRDGFAVFPNIPQPFPRIQGGVINVSSVYSQGLLDTLTRALQSSGVDLSRANISVQIDLGKNATVAPGDTSAKVATTPESSAQSHQSQGRTRPAPSVPESEPARKRPKVENHE
ncbi:uncharacterized protein [Physcomitrium patens]|uniref:BHLH domain-containing protein n=1 Tax=Physcomitrium patens TaxID=3218 RepID=A0A2K1JMX7_PHYPA|nr:uncharacterized protein LOC112290452 [Physcomitrium patens]PNR42894.1 hypothetical protein PHYPA_017726 [Physcomitrium patens]|eukprot:XP_024392458.1 uncharacterized protein LOC112290452 [Physcomitrella patens]